MSEDVYQVPIGSLTWGSPANDEGRIQIRPEFLEAPPVTRLDIIRDWLAVLRELRDETHEEIQETISVVPESEGGEG